MISELQSVGIDLKGRTSGQFKTQCPRCSPQRKHHRDPCLSVNIDDGVYTCWNCGWNGTVKTNKIKQKEYTIPEHNNTSLTQKTLDYFKGRGISKNTLLRFGITESEEYMPAAGAKMNTINFNYTRDGELVNIKFRDAKKNFKMVSGAELIMYGLDLVAGAKEIIITEGEFDALAFYEAGVHQVCSVPNGASKGNQRLEYLDNCLEAFDQAEKIYIATDGDEAGRSLRDELSRRLGKDRCFMIEYPENTKDANDVLLAYGREAVKDLVSNAREFPLDGILETKDFEDELDELFFNGHPKGCVVGLPEWDQKFSFFPGQLTIVTGVPGSGKSNFVDQLLVKLSDIHGWRHGIFSAEKPAHVHASEIIEKYIKKPFTPGKDGSTTFRMSEEEAARGKLFLDENFFFFNVSDENLTIDGLLEKGKQLVKRRGINLLLLDPYNYIEHKIPAGVSETNYISEVLTKIKRFATMYDCHVMLVAHPVKVPRDKETGKYIVPDLYMISGSAHFFNKTDNGFVVWRDFEEDRSEVHVKKIRFAWAGSLGMVEFKWDWKTRSYTEIPLEKFDDGIF